MSALARLRKVRKMTAAEIRFRVADALRKQRERLVHRLDGARWRSALPAPIAERLPARAAVLVPGLEPGARAGLAARHPRVHAAVCGRAASQAARILDARWPLLGHAIDLTGPIDWHRDPESGFAWPRVFYADVPIYSAAPRVDVKDVWEVSRHQFLFPLALHGALAGDERAARRVRALMLDWIEANPLHEGVHWTSGLEVAVRAISWLWSLAALSDWSGWQAADLARIGASLVDHGRFLEHHLSVYSSPYNHLIAEATGLVLLGHWLEGHPRARRWLARGRRVLLEHGPRQFYADGFTVEQAVGYHYFTLGFFAHAVAVERRGSRRALDALDPLLRRAFAAGSAFRQPDDRWPAIGDVDSARALPVTTGDFWDFRAPANVGAILFGSPAFATSDGGPGEDALWLLGPDGWAAWERLAPRGEAPAPRAIRKATATVLPDAGYALAADGAGDWICFDAGPLGDGLHADATPSVGHGHLDALQVLLFRGGQPVLIDSGIPGYNDALEEVDHFRGADAHTGIQVGGAPLARFAGRLAWSHCYRAAKLRAGITQQAWVLQGRVEGPDGVALERFVLGIPGRAVWACDRVAAPGAAPAVWSWQLSVSVEQAALTTSSDAVEVALTETTRLRIRPGAPGAQTTVERGERLLGVRAPGYGVREAGVAVRLTSPAAAAHACLWSIDGVLDDVVLEAKGESQDAGLLSGLGEAALFVWRVPTEAGAMEYAALEGGWAADRAGDAARSAGWEHLPATGDLTILRRRRHAAAPREAAP